MSPDGKSLAYLAPSKDKDVLNVWVRSIDSDNAKMVTKDELRGIRYTGTCKHSLFVTCTVAYIMQKGMHRVYPQQRQTNVTYTNHNEFQAVQLDRGLPVHHVSARCGW